MITEIGRLCHDVEVKEVKANKKVLNNTLAITMGKEKATFLNFVAWDGTAELISKHFKKGDEIFVEGHLENAQIKRRDVEFQTVQLVIRSFRYVNGKVEKKQEQ